MSYYETVSSTILKIMSFCFIVPFLLTMLFTRLIWIEYIIFCSKNKYIYWDELFFVSFFVLSRLAKISSFAITTTFHVYCCSWINIYIWFYSFNGRNILLLDVIFIVPKGTLNPYMVLGKYILLALHGWICKLLVLIKLKQNDRLVVFWSFLKMISNYCLKSY